MAGYLKSLHRYHSTFWMVRCKLRTIGVLCSQCIFQGAYNVEHSMHDLFGWCVQSVHIISLRGCTIRCPVYTVHFVRYVQFATSFKKCILFGGYNLVHSVYSKVLRVRTVWYTLYNVYYWSRLHANTRIMYTPVIVYISFTYEPDAAKPFARSTCRNTDTNIACLFPVSLVLGSPCNLSFESCFY